MWGVCASCATVVDAEPSTTRSQGLDTDCVPALLEAKAEFVKDNSEVVFTALKDPEELLSVLAKAPPDDWPDFRVGGIEPRSLRC